jgi:hypothetical protein
MVRRALETFATTTLRADAAEPIGAMTRNNPDINARREIALGFSNAACMQE